MKVTQWMKWSGLALVLALGKIVGSELLVCEMADRD